MVTAVVQSIIGGVIASIAWFIAGGVLYMNPVVAKIYKEAEASPALKKWPNVPKYLLLQYIGVLIQCLLWAWVFTLIKPALSDEILGRGIMFGFILVFIKIFPRFYDMWIQSTYPNKLLKIEFINGTIGSFIIAMVFAYII